MPDSATRARPHSASQGRATTVDCPRSEEHTSELQSHCNLVCRLLLEKKKKKPGCSISKPDTTITSMQAIRPPIPYPTPTISHNGCFRDSRSRCDDIAVRTLCRCHRYT